MLFEINGRKIELTENEAHVEAAIAWLKATGGPASALVAGELERRGAEISRLAALVRQTREEAEAAVQRAAEGELAARADIDRLTARLQTVEKLLREREEEAASPALTLRERVAEALFDCPACGDGGDMPEEYPATLADLATIAVSHGVSADGLCEREAEAMARATPDETHG